MTEGITILKNPLEGGGRVLRGGGKKTQACPGQEKRAKHRNLEETKKKKIPRRGEER